MHLMKEIFSTHNLNVFVFVPTFNYGEQKSIHVTGAAQNKFEIFYNAESWIIERLILFLNCKKTVKLLMYS